MKTRMFFWVGALSLWTGLGCIDAETDPASPLAKTELALDNVYIAPADMSLLLVGDGGDWQTVARVLEEVGGSALHVLPPRLIVGQVPAFADPVLQESGLAARITRAVEDGEISFENEAEARFVRVFNNRYYPKSVPEGERLTLRHAVVSPGEAWESSASAAAIQRTSRALEKALATSSMDDDIAAESYLAVPYASGTVVVSVWLPESNGVGEPSTEDWTEEHIAMVYEKIQTALEAFARQEPNSLLRFVLHFESAPDHGGLPGTIDHDWEFGKQANWGSGSNESRSVARMLGRVLGRDDITEDNWWDASRDYVNGLKKRYNADAAFYVMVACNANGTAGLRAHAYLHGPSTTLDSLNDWSVFMHEFGHIFGAGDEYCPDACWLPTSIHGYLGAINANAEYFAGGPGIDHGRGEAQPSLMTYNVVNALNGYTRSALGWLDSDGDGLVEVRDTYPRSALEPVVDRDQRVHLQGWIVDVPQSPLWQTRFSANRLETLEVRFADVEGSPWFELPLAGLERGRERVDVDLGLMPLGSHTVEVRAINSVRNTEPTPKRLAIQGTATRTAPWLRLSSPLKVGGLATRFPIEVSYLDLDGDRVVVNLDLDADGVLETTIENPRELLDLHTPPLAAGRREVRAVAQDATGLSTSALLTLFVLDGNAPPAVEVSTPTSQVNGSSEAEVHLEVSKVLDPEGEQVLFNWIVEIAGEPNNTERVETGFGANPNLDTVLRTPSRLVTYPMSFPPIGSADFQPWRIRDSMIVRRDVLAMALGDLGVALFDIQDRKAPVLLGHLRLETSAKQLYRDGDKLYVLGGQMTIVDISDLCQPKELPQWKTTESTIVSKIDAPQDIWNCGWSAYHSHWQIRDEKITDVAVKVVLDHPDPSKLTITLETDMERGLGNIVLMDRDPNAVGRRTFHFNPSNTPGLEQVKGVFSSGNWGIMVVEQSGEGTPADPIVSGSLISSRIRFKTAHRAIPVLEGASRIVGALQARYVVVIGSGLQVIDTAGNNQPAPPPSGKNTLLLNKSIGLNGYLESVNQAYRFYLQNDGNLVLRTWPDETVLWASNTVGLGGEKLIMQSDGNLVLYKRGNRPVWASNTVGSGAARLTLGDSGTLGIYNRSGDAVWSKPSSGSAVQAALLRGPWITNAALVGQTVVGGAFPAKEPADEKAGSVANSLGSTPTELAGLFAVNLSSPYAPVITRREPISVEELVVVGSRMYVGLIVYEAPEGTPPTLVGDVNAFVRGQPYELARTNFSIRRGAEGDDTELWTPVQGIRYVHFDVSEPDSIRVLESVDTPYMNQALRIGDREILGYNWSDIFVAKLDEYESVLSRVYQVTLEAKDSRGAVTREVRTLHVVPYAHTPSISSVEVLSGQDADDTYELLVRVADPDLGASWDPYTFARGDFDQDGVFESQWFWGGDNGEVHIFQKFPSAGTYNLELEARDGFYGRSERSSFTLVVPAHVDVPCGGSHGETCQPDEFCQRLGDNACDKTTVGTCQHLWEPCPYTEIEQPACGCNGVTYLRPCDAYYEGVNVASLGECPAVSCTQNENCAVGLQFCFFEPNFEDPSQSCGHGGPGICRPIPEKCTTVFSGGEESILPMEVCGCDGRNYSSGCEANQSGVSVLHNGVCEKQ